MLDTNVLISGLLWRGAPHECLLAAEAGWYELVSAEAILNELQEKLVEKFGNTADEAEESIDGLRRVAKLVPLTGRTGWVEKDPDDDMFVEAAIVATVDMIVSGDRHLLELGEVENIPVLKPRQFLDRLSPSPL